MNASSWWLPTSPRLYATYNNLRTKQFLTHDVQRFLDLIQQVLTLLLSRTKMFLEMVFDRLVKSFDLDLTNMKRLFNTLLYL